MKLLGNIKYKTELLILLTQMQTYACFNFLLKITGLDLASRKLSTTCVKGNYLVSYVQSNSVALPSVKHGDIRANTVLIGWTVRSAT